MKNKQKTISKILTLMLILCTLTNLSSQTLSKTVEKADSLYARRQYTQSLELYREILNQRSYSESMLLKMAFIQEGLGHLSESLYYLNLYYLVSDDEQAAAKMNELASRYHLQGYQTNPSKTIYALIRKNFDAIVRTLVAIIAFLFALLIYQKRKQRSPMPVAIIILLMLGGLFFHVNFSRDIHSGIVRSNSTYLMSGPSAGSSVVNIIGAGHQVDVIGKKDVWLRVMWMEQEAYLREDQLLMIQL